jgi:hypothetical protein
MISSDVASCCSKKATSPIQESSNLSKAAIHSKKKKKHSMFKAPFETGSICVFKIFKFIILNFFFLIIKGNRDEMLSIVIGDKSQM